MFLCSVQTWTVLVIIGICHSSFLSLNSCISWCSRSRLGCSPWSLLTCSEFNKTTYLLNFAVTFETWSNHSNSTPQQCSKKICKNTTELGVQTNLRRTLYLAFWLLPVSVWIAFPYFSPDSPPIRKYNLRLLVCELCVLSLLGGPELMLFDLLNNATREVSALLKDQMNSRKPDSRKHGTAGWSLQVADTMLQIGNQKAPKIKAQKQILIPARALILM